MNVFIVSGAVVFGVTFVAAMWRWKQQKEADWFFAWVLAFAGALLSLATVRL